MDTIKFTEKGNVKMIAHRGLSGLERENTNAAFVAAGQRSYYGIETDVHVTADEKYIIIHENLGTRIKLNINPSLLNMFTECFKTPVSDFNKSVNVINRVYMRSCDYVLYSVYFCHMAHSY